MEIKILLLLREEKNLAHNFHLKFKRLLFFQAREGFFGAEFFFDFIE